MPSMGLSGSPAQAPERVTSCRDHVLLAQTKVEFLTGGRGRNFRELTDADKNAQREEAYARAQWPSQESQ